MGLEVHASPISRKNPLYEEKSQFIVRNIHNNQISFGFSEQDEESNLKQKKLSQQNEFRKNSSAVNHWERKDKRIGKKLTLKADQTKEQMTFSEFIIENKNNDCINAEINKHRRPRVIDQKYIQTHNMNTLYGRRNEANNLRKATSLEQNRDNLDTEHFKYSQMKVSIRLTI